MLGEKARLTLWLLMGAAAFVLIISCANVANLTLMRGVRREHELVVRAALGAGAARLRRLLLVENLVLAFGGRACSGSCSRSAACGCSIALAERYSPRAERDPARRRGARLHAAARRVVVALLLSFAPTLAKEGIARRVDRGGREPHRAAACGASACSGRSSSRRSRCR